MMHQGTESASRAGGARAVSAQPLHVLAYRSVAVLRPTDAEIQELLRASQARNNAEGLTGVLIYDDGAFFQWLEGPTEGLARVWDSILHDVRHHRITVLRDEPIDGRVFEGWDLRLAHGSPSSVETAVAALQSSNHRLRDSLARPQSVLELSWEDLFATVVIPRLRLVHGRDVLTQARFRSTRTIWHADEDSGAKFARVLIAPKAGDLTRYVDSMLDQGATLNALYQEVFEPAQLHLGRLWDDDRCDDFHLTLGLTRMQLELLRVNVALPFDHTCKPGLSVLLSAQPNEVHRLGLLMSSEVFNRSGWEVICQSPGDDRYLTDLLHEQWFDVLKLSQSGSLRRDGRLDALRTTIDSARAASVNPSLIVLVDGRTFVERPQVFHSVHANAMSRSVLEAVPLAERLLAASTSVTALCQVSSA
jgi:hypothetical protein